MYISLDRQEIVDASNNSVGDIYPKIYTRNSILFRARLLLSGAAFQIPVGTQFYCGIDKVSEQNVSDLVTINNDQFLEADWDEWSLVGGKICWRCNTNRPGLLADMGVKEWKVYFCGLWMTVPGEEPSLLVEFKIKVMNSFTNVLSVDQEVSKTFVPVDMLDLYLRKKEPYADIRFASNGLMYRYCIDNHLWYPVALRLVGGKPVLVVGETGVEEI